MRPNEWKKSDDYISEDYIYNSNLNRVDINIEVKHLLNYRENTIFQVSFIRSLINCSKKNEHIIVRYTQKWRFRFTSPSLVLVHAQLHIGFAIFKAACWRSSWQQKLELCVRLRRSSRSGQLRFRRRWWWSEWIGWPWGSCKRQEKAQEEQKEE